MIPAAILLLQLRQLKEQRMVNVYSMDFYLKMSYLSTNHKKRHRNDDINIRDGNQIPATNKVDREIFEAPTKLRIKFDKPYCLNSITILSNLKPTHKQLIGPQLL